MAYAADTALRNCQSINQKYVLSCLWESAHTRSLAANRKKLHMWVQLVSSKEICHNERVFDVKYLMIRKAMYSRCAIK